MSTLRTQALRYVLLPGIVPRIWALLSGGFGHIAWFMALIYNSVDLLPSGHPYLNITNRGRYGIRHVVAQAANNLVFSRHNIDQIVVFFTLLAGVVLLLVQVALLLFALFTSQDVMAQTTYYGFDIPGVRDMFFVNSPYGHGSSVNGEAQDLAFIVFEKVFGVQNIFKSCISNTAVACEGLRGNTINTPGTFPYPIHLALHDLLRFYSFGIFIISVFIILYLIVVLVGETAVSGTPFGQRANKVWMVIRLIVFSALLVPLNIGVANGGLNGAQILTFWIAKGGSNLATNAWGRFNDNLVGTYLGETESLIAQPEIPELQGLLQYMFIAKVCKMVTEEQYPELSTGNGMVGAGVQPYLVRPPGQYHMMPNAPDALDANTTDFDVAIQHVDHGNITIRFGVIDERPDPPVPLPDPSTPGFNIDDYSDTKYTEQWGHVFPYCGDIQVQLTHLDQSGSAMSGSMKITKYYYDMVLAMWNDTLLTDHAECVLREADNSLSNVSCPSLPGTTDFQFLYQNYQGDMRTQLPLMIEEQIQNADWVVPPELREKGWAGAGIWFNRIAHMNGKLTTALLTLPVVTQFPFVMTSVARQQVAHDLDISGEKMFNPEVTGNYALTYPMPNDQNVARALYLAYILSERADMDEDMFTYKTGNTFVDMINWLFGTSGIYNIRNNTDVHPLAQLTTLGKSMMEASVRNLGYTFMSGMGKMALDGVPKQLVGVAGEFFKIIAFSTLAMSFAMYAILPFMPFIYFFFAFSGWIKSIFEAIVAMPLWALAHLRIDGNGLPGQGGMNGYYLLLEIFLRPVLIIFGLLASINIYSAMVRALNNTYDLVVINVAGSDAVTAANTGTADLVAAMRNPIDEFMFTGVYVIIVFLSGQACFKLVDSIPNQILRWFGTNIATFQENAGDPAGKTLDMSYKGITMGANQLEGGALAFIL